MSSVTLLYYFAPACAVINAFYIMLFEFEALRTAKPSEVGLMVFLVNGCVTFGLNIASVAVVSLWCSIGNTES